MVQLGIQDRVHPLPTYKIAESLGQALSKKIIHHIHHSMLLVCLESLAKPYYAIYLTKQQDN